MDEIKNQKTYTQEEVKKWLRVGRNTMARLVKEGQLSPKLVGRRYVYLGEDLLKFIRGK